MKKNIPNTIREGKEINQQICHRICHQREGLRPCSIRFVGTFICVLSSGLCLEGKRAGLLWGFWGKIEAGYGELGRRKEEGRIDGENTKRLGKRRNVDTRA